MTIVGVRGWRRRAVVAGVAVSALVLSGCGGGEDGSSEASPSSAGPAGSVAAEVDALVASMPAAATGIDPMKTIFTQNVWMLHLVGGTLFAFVPGEVAETVPALAESGELSADGMTATVTLKPDLEFSDGTPLTSADVVGTFQHDLEQQQVPGASFFANVAGVSAPDESTVVIEFKTPNPQYQVDLALFPFTIVPDGSWEDPDFATNLISAGPYAVDGELTGEQVVLTRNESYAGPTPAVKELTFQVIADPAAALNQLQTGQINFQASLPPVNVATLPDGLTAGKVEPWLISLFSFNQTDPLLADVKIRQAIGFALDRTQLNEVAQSGQGQPWGSEFSPTFGLDEGDFPAPFPLTADLEQARSLLEGTECESGCSFSVNVIGGSVNNQYAVVAQQQLAEIGIELEVVPLDPNTFNQRNFAGQYQSLFTAGGAFSGSAALNLTLNPMGPTRAMFSQYQSQEMVDAVVAANSALGTDGQDDAFQAIAELYETDTPWVPIASQAYLWASDEKATGNLFFSPTGLPDVPTLEN